MSAPPAGSGSGSTTAGYYPDPSIPGYVRYWDGAAWVPGTSRPEPRPGEPVPTAPGEEQPPAQPEAHPPSPAHGSSGFPSSGQHAADVPSPRDESAPSAPDGPPLVIDQDGAVLPELRPRGDVDVHGGQQITDWDDPSRLHGQRPASATAWQADVSQQSGFGGEQDQRVAWGAEDPNQQVVDPRHTGWTRPQAAPAGEAPAVTAAQPPRPTPPAQPAAPQPPAQPAAPNPSVEPAPPESPARPASAEPPQRAPRNEQTTQLRRAPQPEQTTQLRRSDIMKARRAARAAAEAQQAQHVAPPPQPVPPTAWQPPPAAHQAVPAPAPGSAPPGPGAADPGWPQQVRDLAQPGPAGSGQGGADPHAAHGADDAPAPWRPPASDPFLRAAQDQARPAGLGRRFAARLIDSLVTCVVTAVVALPLLSKARDHIDAKIEEVEQAGVNQDVWLLDGTTSLYLAMVIGAVLLFGLLYEALPNARWGRTFGKKLCGLRVLSMAEQEPPSYGRAALRWLVQGTLSLLVVGVVNLLWALFDKPWRQCWHDKVAGTFTAEGGGELRLD